MTSGRERYLELLDEQDRLIEGGELERARALNQELRRLAIKFATVTRDAEQAGSVTPPAVAPPAAGPSSSSRACHGTAASAPRSSVDAATFTHVSPSRTSLRARGWPRCRNCGGHWNGGAELLCEACWEVHADLFSSWRDVEV